MEDGLDQPIDTHHPLSSSRWYTDLSGSAQEEEGEGQAVLLELLKPGHESDVNVTSSFSACNGLGLQDPTENLDLQGSANMENKHLKAGTRKVCLGKRERERL